MLYEIRRYVTKPGLRAEWVKYMEDVILPFQMSVGVVFVAAFTDDEDPDAYVWIRRFENEEQRIQQYKDVYESERWKTEMDAKVGALLDRSKTVVTRAVPTLKSVLR
jgi:hypothetical protein